MQEAMLTGLFGALTTEHRMNMIANNLANVNTNGYKRDTLAFKDTMHTFAHDEIREPLATVRSDPLFPEPKNVARPRIAVAKTDFTQGSMEYTGNPLDLAISGDAFFKVDTGNGSYYSRNGHFVISAEGTVVTPQGWALQGTDGNIVVPANTKNLHVGIDGQVSADGVLINSVDLVTVENLANLKKLGSNLYRPEENVEVVEQNALGNGVMLSQGFLEKSNVQVVLEMVNMIETNRIFDAYQKVIQASSTVDREAYSKLGMRA